MSLDNLYGMFYFNSFEDVVAWLTCAVPYVLVAVFVLNCVFNIFEIIMHLGGKR